MLAETKFALLGMLSAAAGKVAGAVVPDVALRWSLADFLQVNVPLPILIVGLGFAAMGGSLAMAVSPPDPAKGDPKWSVLLTLGVALFFGLIVAMAHPAIPLLNGASEQVAMALGGMASRPSMILIARGELPFLKKWLGK